MFSIKEKFTAILNIFYKKTKEKGGKQMRKMIAKIAEKYAKMGATSAFLLWHQAKAPKSLIK